jgi:hypothetical protein
LKLISEKSRHPRKKKFWEKSLNQGAREGILEIDEMNTCSYILALISPKFHTKIAAKSEAQIFQKK